ncbi:MAG TPA: Hsp20/alpha crystallin family protein [Kofleriaceae bacterium]|nr:Hsp20/alpha crystallin family protein [Kofleriaceae bacterium]
MTSLTLRRTRPSFSLFDPFDLSRDLFGLSPFAGLDVRRPQGGGRFVPTFDLSEHDDAYIIEADLPGVREEDLDIHVTGNQLTVSGTRKAESREESESVYVYERKHGSFARTFSLPQNSVGGDIEASLADGVLKVVVPKAPEAKPRKIPLSTRIKERLTGDKPAAQG